MQNNKNVSCCALTHYTGQSGSVDVNVQSILNLKHLEVIGSFIKFEGLV